MFIVKRADAYLELVRVAVGVVDDRLVECAVDTIRTARDSFGKVWIVGNGGSAATAMHFANDLIKMAKVDAEALPWAVPVITAYGNDEGWGNMFSMAMKRFSMRDVLVAISYSGRSENVLRALVVAEKRNGHSIMLTGPMTSDNHFTERIGLKIPVNVDDIRAVEDAHLAICHAIAGALTE